MEDRLGVRTSEQVQNTYSQLVLFRQFIHTQDSNDILKGLVVLKNLLDGSGDLIMLPTDNAWIQHARLGVQGVDSGVNTQLSNRTRQYSGGVQVGESGSGGRISQIVGRDVDGLDGCNRTLLGGGDTLLPSKEMSNRTGGGKRTVLTCHPYQWRVSVDNRRQREYDQVRRTLRNRPGDRKSVV